MPACSAFFFCNPTPINPQPQVLVLLLENLPVMPAVQQPLLFRRLLPLVAAIPSAAQRTRGLARLWSAVLRFDWAGGERRGERGGAAHGPRGGAAAAPAPQLQQLLLEPAVKEALTGTPGSGDIGAALAAAAAGPAPPPIYAAYREELVGSLLYVLLSHPHGVPGSVAGASAAVGASSLVTEASEMQALVESAEWLASARTALQVCMWGVVACVGWGGGWGRAFSDSRQLDATTEPQRRPCAQAHPLVVVLLVPHPRPTFILPTHPHPDPWQGTKACLGWDRVAAALTTGTSAVTDLWLQLLLATIQVAAAIKAHLAARVAEAAGAGADGAQVRPLKRGGFLFAGIP